MGFSSLLHYQMQYCTFRWCGSFWDRVDTRRLTPTAEVGFLYIFFAGTFKHSTCFYGPIHRNPFLLLKTSYPCFLRNSDSLDFLHHRLAVLPCLSMYGWMYITAGRGLRTVRGSERVLHRRTGTDHSRLYKLVIFTFLSFFHGLGEYTMFFPCVILRGSTKKRQEYSRHLSHDRYQPAKGREKRK